MRPDVPAADRFDDASKAALVAAQQLGITGSTFAVLHRSNNVVFGVGDTVLKVGREAGRLGREVALADHAARNGGPVIAPLGDVLMIDDFVVSVWPFRTSDPVPADDVTAAWALVHLHRSLADTSVPLPTLADRFADVQKLLGDEAATALMPGYGRGVLARAVGLAVVDATADDIVLHGEPHDRNRLTLGGAVVYFDLEAVCRGPLEWDIAYFEEPTAEAVWPDHDRDRCAGLRVAVSACVSVYCWRHVTARPDDDEMRWHAEHHLAAVRRALDRGP